MSSRIERQRVLLQLFTHVSFPSRFVDERQIDYENVKLQGLGRLSKRETFSTFAPEHMAEAKEFYDVLLSARDFDEFLNLAFSARDILNEGLFVFATSRAVMNCSMCVGLLVPPIHEIFPGKFIPSDTINRAIKLYLDRTHDESQMPPSLTVTVDETGSPENEEHSLAYFREDIGLNSHHWHWHLVYPFNGPTKDRKGELFYYMHQQLLARYDCERLAAGLKLVKAIYNYDEPLQGYASHLLDLDCGKSHASRPDGMRIQEVNHLVRWRERIMEAIHQKYLIDNAGNRVPLDAGSGIDLLAAVVEASADSKNPDYYGNMHNMFHVNIANIHDPKGKFKELDGVIGNGSTAVRDPVFFQLHRFVDDIFDAFKRTLPPYTQEELNFPGIEIREVILEGKEPNVIFTYMRKATLELSHAIRMKISVKVEYEHLDHDPFVYTIKVNNTTGSNKDVTVRLFMAPKNDEIGKEFSLNNQRRYFIEMDKFHAVLASGENALTRNSSESSVTVPYIPSFQELQEKAVILDKQGKDITNIYCSCGWPQHLLVPRGTFRGMDFKLFVMLTDHTKDFVGNIQDEPKCAEAVSYCGLKDQKYPDKKPMGFPFDRRITGSKTTDFTTPNMRFTDVKIQFTGLKLILQTSATTET